MEMIINQLLALDWGVLLGGFAVIVVAVPRIKCYLSEFESESGFQFPWTTRKKAIQKKFDELENKIYQNRKEIDEKIDSIHKQEHIEYESWRQQSVAIRNNLSDNQKRLENNQDAFMKTLSEISISLADIKADLLDERLERKRWNILNCASKLRNLECVDMEEFTNVFADYDSYEDLIRKNGKVNGLIEESIKFIREKYQEMLCSEK